LLNYSEQLFIAHQVGERIMFEEMLIPLKIAECLGTIKGKTRLQKIVFLIQKEAERKNVDASSFEYEIYRYGPFSFQLSGTLEKLLSDKLLEEKVEMTPNGYTKYVYELTVKGKNLLKDAKTKELISPELIHIIQQTAKNYGEVQLSDVVTEAYRKFSE
jgi:uncharacterized protein YwgA